MYRVMAFIHNFMFFYLFFNLLYIYIYIWPPVDATHEKETMTQTLQNSFSCWTAPGDYLYKIWIKYTNLKAQLINKWSHSCPSFFLIKLQAFNKLQHKFISVNSAKLLRPLIFTEHFRRLFLKRNKYTCFFTLSFCFQRQKSTLGS